VLAALDHADDRGEGPVPTLWKRVTPFGGALVASAAMLVLFGTVVKSRADSPIVKDAIRGYEKPLPVEVGCCEDQVRSWMVGKVAVPVRPPIRRAAVQAAQAVQLVGARIGHVRGEDAAELVYQVGDSRLTVYVFDPSGIPMEAPQMRVIDHRQVYLDGERGYNVAFYRDRGVGYAFASDLDQDSMLQIVSASLTDE
jgi:anti-sigma factor RsiW